MLSLDFQALVDQTGSCLPTQTQRIILMHRGCLAQSQNSGDLILWKKPQANRVLDYLGCKLDRLTGSAPALIQKAGLFHVL